MKIGRASIYYYFKGKGELLKEIIEKYFIKPMHDEFNDLAENATIKEFIDCNVRIIKSAADDIGKLSENITSTQFFTLLLKTYTRARISRRG